MNVTSNTAIGYSVATSSSESLLNGCESLISQRNFVSDMQFNMVKFAFNLAVLSVHSAEVVFKSILEG